MSLDTHLAPHRGSKLATGLPDSFVRLHPNLKPTKIDPKSIRNPWISPPDVRQAAP